MKVGDLVRFVGSYEEPTGIGIVVGKDEAGWWEICEITGYYAGCTCKTDPDKNDWKVISEMPLTDDDPPVTLQE